MATVIIKAVCSEAEGAYPNGTRVKKILAEEKDAHPLGALGTISGSVGPVPDDIREAMRASRGFDVRYGYFVKWDDNPELPVFIIDVKIGRIDEEKNGGS